MDLHPYNGIERCFRHTDSEREAGLALVANVLQLPKTVPVDHAMYDLSFYSGGIGVLDHLAITLPVDSATWARVVEALHGKTPEQVSEDTTWAAELMWLFIGEERAVQIRETAVGFINDQRREFQAECHSTDYMFFADGSGVNWWTALWCNDTTLNFLSFDQG